MACFVYQSILTPEKDGSYRVEVPDLPSCAAHGATFQKAIEMAADAMRARVTSLLLHGETVPMPTRGACPAGSELVEIAFQTDEGSLVEGPCISAAQAARELGVSASRITRMLDAGQIDGYRIGRRTWISVPSIEARKNASPKPGRPRKTHAASAGASDEAAPSADAGANEAALPAR